MTPEESWKYVQVGKEAECWPCSSTSRDRGGHRLVYVDGGYKYAHRIAYELKVGPIPPKFLVLHTCDNAACCNPKHLKLGNHSDNLKDSYAGGKRTSISGSRNGRAKLTETVVRIIRGSNDTNASLARRFNVEATAVARARSYKTWKNI